MRLNDKGQCPVCLRKPLTYKRSSQYFCTKCDRSFAISTGKFQPNWKWDEPHKEKPHRYDCLCGNCPSESA